MKIELGGFKTIDQTDVEVGIDRTVDLVMTLQVQGLAETVNVTSVSPTVDTQSTSIGINANADLFERIPVRRDFYAIARLAPGTTEDAVGPAVLGSTGAENQYIIEGLNTTGIERAEKTKRLNFDFVEAIEVKTGGLNAEYGRMTGGIINVITKSGGNTFRGSFFGFTEGGALRSDDSTARSAAGDHDHGRKSGRAVGCRRRDGRLHRQGQAVVLRRLQPPVRAHPHTTSSVT